ncbi:CC137 protein, partial [Hemiprocne comata]|nr:CC137 protein [Hemiprocne comata]
GRGRGQGPGRGQRQGQRSGQGQAPGRGTGQKSGQGPAPGRGPAALHRGRSVPWGSGRDCVCQAPGLGPGPTRDQGAGVPLCQAPGALRQASSGVHSFPPRKEKKVDNMKPKHPDDQEIPFRLRELIKSREAMKHPDPGKRRVAEKKQQPKSKGTKAQGDIPVPKFRRGKGESERSYIYRMEQEVQRVLFLSKNQLQREPEKQEMAPEKSKRKKEFQNKKLEKARKKKEEKKEAMLEKSLLQGGSGTAGWTPPVLGGLLPDICFSPVDTVAFGEVVTQPPTITSRPRGRGPAEQAGRKRLLLMSRLGQSQVSLVSPVSPAAPVSMARRRIVEEERARVIQAYRDIQNRKQQQREVAQASGRAGRRVPR